MKKKRIKFGWKPDVPDLRDIKYVPAQSTKLKKGGPSGVDLRDRFFQCWDQGSLGSCTAQAVAAACQFLDIYDDDMDIVTPSRLFLYYNTRLIEKTTASDEGAQIRNAIKSAALYGYPAESQCKYLVSDFAKKPTPLAYRSAKKEAITKYMRVERNIAHFKSLLTNGYPVIIGIAVYDSIDKASVTKSGVIPMPKKNETMQGGHAILVVGFDDAKSQFIFRNSWGKSWGDEGHGYLPYAYIESTDLSDDFWVIKR